MKMKAVFSFFCLALLASCTTSPKKTLPFNMEKSTNKLQIDSYPSGNWKTIIDSKTPFISRFEQIPSNQTATQYSDKVASQTVHVVSPNVSYRSDVAKHKKQLKNVCEKSGIKALDVKSLDVGGDIVSYYTYCQGTKNSRFGDSMVFYKVFYTQFGTYSIRREFRYHNGLKNLSLKPEHIEAQKFLDKHVRLCKKTDSTCQGNLISRKDTKFSHYAVLKNNNKFIKGKTSINDVISKLGEPAKKFKSGSLDTLFYEINGVNHFYSFDSEGKLAFVKKLKKMN